MTQPDLQQAINAIWPGIEKEIAGIKDTPDAKALRHLKDVFLQRTLPATATHVPAKGKWGDWTRSRGSPPPDDPDGPVVVSLQRDYDLAGGPIGLVERAACISLTVDQLKESVPDADGKPTGPALAAVKNLGATAVCEQIGYAMTEIMKDGDFEEGPAGTVLEVVRAARRCFPDTVQALTVLVHRQNGTGMDETAKKAVRRQLTGGSIVELPWGGLKDSALVLAHKSPEAIWYTAFDLQLGWGPASSDVAEIDLVSRLVLARVVAKWRRYRALLLPDDLAASPPGAPDPPAPAPTKRAPATKKQRRPR